MKGIIITDKELVVVGLVTIAIFAFIYMGNDAESVITAIVSGMCGIAVGKSLNSNPDTSSKSIIEYKEKTNNE
jgi:hypothetical protein